MQQKASLQQIDRLKNRLGRIAGQLAAETRRAQASVAQSRALLDALYKSRRRWRESSPSMHDLRY